MNRALAAPKRLACLALALLLAAPLFAGDENGPKELPRAARRWINKTLKEMTVEERIGQLIMAPFFGQFANIESEAYTQLVRQVRELHLGGVVVATRSKRPTGYDKTDVYGLTRMLNRLQRVAAIPLLVAADFERGASFRVNTTTDFPYKMTVGAAGSAELAYEMGRVTAQEARALGVHMVLAPVADVNNNPENPIINIRSFGEDPEQVARLVAAFVRGVEENGALATAKHFPGHGDTSVDSHLNLPVITGDRERLDTLELVPFRAAIDAGVSSVMPGHLAVPAVDPDETTPATFSRAILTGLLREQMGFDGIIITDAMVMNAITNEFWAGEAAVRAVEAGVDIVLMPPDPRVAFDALRRAAESGRLSIERVDESVRRILTAKARMGLYDNVTVTPEEAERSVAKPASKRIARELAEKGITLLRDDAGLLPIDSTKPQRGLLFIVSGDESVYPGEALEQEMKPRVDELLTVRTDPFYFPPDRLELPEPDQYDWTVVAVFVRVASYREEIGLPDEMKEVIDRVLADDKPAVLLVMGSPYAAQQFPEVKTALLSFGTATVSQRAAARALFGQTAITGRLPVTLPETAERNTGLDRPTAPMTLVDATEENHARFAPVVSILEAAVAHDTTPGGVLAVGHRGSLVALQPFGRYTYDDYAAPVAADSVYDLASLTKVVGTTTAAMQLIENRRLDLDAPIVRYLPEFGQGPDPAWREQVLVRHLLTHSGGLPPYVRFFLELDNRKEMMERIYAMPLEYPVGTQAIYSDLGIILLGEIIERVSGRPLDEYLQREVFEPLAMTQTRYNPPEEWLARIAPTEFDQEFRHRLVRGEVHDENAWVMSGVAPHAGLFSTARDLATFCQFLLNGGIYAHRRLLKRETIERFTRRQDIPDSTRAIGWDTPSERSSGGHYLSGRAFGHTGFTGTSIWIDPEKELFVILLTNRVHPTRENIQIRQLRPAVHDAVMEALGLAGSSPEAGPQ